MCQNASGQSDCRILQSAISQKKSEKTRRFEKEVRDKVDFCRDKLQKVGTVISDGCSKACLNYSK